MSCHSIAITGKRLAEADPWAFACFMNQLRAEADGAQSPARRSLAHRILRELPSATIKRRCTCGDAGCHSYTFVADPLRLPAAHLASLAFPLFAGCESFEIFYALDGTLVGVELWIDE